MWSVYRQSSGYLSRVEGLLGTGGLRKPHRHVCLSRYGLLNKNVVSERASKWGRDGPGGQRGQGQGRVSVVSTPQPHGSSCLQCLYSLDLLLRLRPFSTFLYQRKRDFKEKTQNALRWTYEPVAFQDPRKKRESLTILIVRSVLVPECKIQGRFLERKFFPYIGP